MAASDNRAVEELLPFWLNGTLEGDERARVDSALETDRSLRQELELLRAMRRGLEESHAPHTGPGEFGLARLHRALDAEQASAVGTANRQPVSVRPDRRAAVWAFGSAIAASLATILMLGAGSPLEQDAETYYEQASGEPPAVLVQFVPDASIAEVSDLVRAAGLTIIDGPSAMGLFRLVPLPGEDGTLASMAAQLEEDARVLGVDIDE